MEFVVISLISLRYHSCIKYISAFGCAFRNVLQALRFLNAPQSCFYSLFPNLDCPKTIVHLL